MGGGSAIRAAVRAAGAGVGGAQGAFPVATSSAGGAAWHGRPPLAVPLSFSASSDSSPSCAALMTERGGERRHPPHPCFCDEDGLGSDGEEYKETAGCGFAERFVFGPVPSREEVVDAVSAIQQTFFAFTSPQNAQDHLSSTIQENRKDETILTDPMNRVASTGKTKSDWIEPSRQVYGSNGIQYQAYDKVIDAFCLLQTNPSMQRTVVSLSSDKAVWDAVMKNQAVKELRESIYAAEHGKSPGSDDGRNVLARLLKWIIECSKAKVIELVNKIAKTVGELFLLQEKGEVGEMDLVEDVLRSSFMLSIMVFIVVIITRFQKALQ